MGHKEKVQGVTDAIKLNERFKKENERAEATKKLAEEQEHDRLAKEVQGRWGYAPGTQSSEDAIVTLHEEHKRGF